MLTIQLNVFTVGERMPDADTDVLIFEGADAEGQLGAFIGADGWVGAVGQPVHGVTHWAEMPDLAKMAAAS
jgi:hypothetical protein